MTRVKAPNGDVYDLPDPVATGLLRSPEWAAADGAATDAAEPLEDGAEPLEGEDVVIDQRLVDEPVGEDVTVDQRLVDEPVGEDVTVDQRLVDEVSEDDDEAWDDDDTDVWDDPEPVDAPAPPRPAKSATKESWAAYAEAVGVDPAGLTRDAIIAAVDEAQATP